MARAKTRSWIKLVAGLDVGAAAPTLFTNVVSFAVSGSALLAAPLPERPLPVHEALNSAIDCHRRGDYEGADELFKYVDQRKDELADAEKQELYRFWHDNVMALDARREGSRQLRLVDKALLEGRAADANELLKKVQPKEQYLAPADKTKSRELYAQLNGKPLELPRPTPVTLPAQLVKPLPTGGLNHTPTNAAPAKPTLADARAKLQQARAQLNQYNLDLADQLTHETERLGVSFPPAEDTPAKLLQDITKARADAKTLLLAARTAMGRQEFDAAAKYAKQSEAVAGTFTFPLWSDSPAKVLKELKEMKEVQAAKANPPAPTLVAPPPSPKPASPVAATPPAPPAAAVQTTSSNKPAVAVSDPMTDKARMLLRQGRKALEENRLPLAKQLAQQAKALQPKLESWEETPDKLLADVGRAEALATAHDPKTNAVKPEKKLPTTKEEAVALVKKARVQLAEGNIEDAQVSVMKARSVKNTSWGIFDDSPESALKDIEKARVKRDQEEAAKVLVEGRKKLEQGDWESAQRAAYRAQKLHGPYTLLDFGDRPDKLLADAQALRNQPHKPDNTAVAKKDDKKTEPMSPIQVVSTLPPVTPPKDYKVSTPLPPLNPTPGAATAPVVVVPPLPPLNPAPKPANVEVLAHSNPRQLLAEARQALKVGDVAKAKALTDEAACLKTTYAPGEDCPALLYDAIARFSQLPAAPVVSHPATTVPPVQPPPAAQTADDAAKVKAKALLAEARQFQKAGKFVEARQKCVEASTTWTAFGPDEDDPTSAYRQIEIMAKQHAEALALQATDLANDGTGEALPRYQRAEQMLQEALTVAKYFGFDTASLDAKMAWLQELRAQAKGVPVAPQPVVQAKLTVPETPADPVQVGKPAPQPAPPPGPTAAQKGQQLLDQARNELRAGALTQARKLAIDAMKDEYGIADEATAVLRTIETEEYNQRCLDDRHTYDAAESSFRLGDFAHAGVLLGAIDPHNLDEPRKQRLRELMQTPGMLAVRHDAVAHTDTPTAPGDAGHSRATDQLPASPETDALKEIAALRVVQFQKLRSDGFKAQNDAAEKARAGDLDQALDVLRIYLDNLNTVSDVDANQLALLRKPVEARLKHLELMKLQDDFTKQDKLASGKTMENRGKRLAAEDVKQKKIADLMKQCNGLIKDGKLDEAYRLALVVREMDPDNAAIEALVLTAELKRNLTASNKMKKEREDYFLGSMLDTDREGKYLTNENPLDIDLDRLNTAKKRPSLDQMIQRKTPAMLEMERKLLTPVTINYKDVSMRQAIDDLRATYALNFDFDDASLTSQGISIDRTLTLRLDGVSLKTAMELLLKKLNLSYVVHEKHIEVTTKENAKGQLVRHVYQVTDLIVPVENSILAPGTPVLPGQPSNSSGLSTLSTGTYTPSPLSATNGYNMSSASGTPVGTAMGAGTPPPSDDNQLVGPYGHTLHKKKMIQTREDALIKLITNTVNPQTWSDMGGPGTIDYFPMGGALVINQSLDIQEQVADLLQALRRLQDQEVAIEVRLITVDEDYYERIGLDFSLDIATNSRNNRFEPALLNNAFAPGNQFNTAATGAARGLLGGLTPAGTLTPDLSIPITPNSFSPAAPTFGGYQGPGVGGLTVGLAFLSDIQVSMLLEAVAGDARSSISQSPRLTLQNGQQANMSVIENLENLVTGVTLTQLPNGAFALVPQVQPINNEVDLQLSAVISADRRFVRVTPQLNLTNVSIGNPAPAPTPILLPIYPTASTLDPGNAVVYTQYLQQPQRISTINLSTTVTVPDGGTVVMGGLKRMSEGRLEYGPPVLSKIPYINRLFRNVGYGRTGTSILIMVTPRIIIQEEEEERATGFVLPQTVVP